MHNISYYFTCVPSKDSDLTAHPKVLSKASLFTVYLKGNKGPKNCGCAVLSEFSLEELAIVGNVQSDKLDPPHPKHYENKPIQIY